MLVKGSKEYKVAGKLAKEIANTANVDRKNNNSYFNIAFEKLGFFLYEVKKLNVFASQISETVEKTMDTYGRKVAFVSDKQAWVLACAAVENGIEWDGVTDELHEKENEVEEIMEQEVEIEELQNEKEDVTYNINDVVEHSKFGEGTVVEVTEDKITIDFEEFTKTFILKFINFKKVK